MSHPSQGETFISGNTQLLRMKVTKLILGLSFTDGYNRRAEQKFGQLI